MLEDQGYHTMKACMQASQCSLWQGLVYRSTVSVVCLGAQGVWKHHSKYFLLQHNLYMDLCLTQVTASGFLLKMTTTEKSILLTERNYDSEKSNFMPYLYEIMYIMVDLFDWNLETQVSFSRGNQKPFYSTTIFTGKVKSLLKIGFRHMMTWKEIQNCFIWAYKQPDSSPVLSLTHSYIVCYQSFSLLVLQWTLRSLKRSVCLCLFKLHWGCEGWDDNWRLKDNVQKLEVPDTKAGIENWYRKHW